MEAHDRQERQKTGLIRIFVTARNQNHKEIPYTSGKRGIAEKNKDGPICDCSVIVVVSLEASGEFTPEWK
jgi:hypothetical protein